MFFYEEQKKKAAQARHETDRWGKMTPDETERCERICTEARKRRLLKETFGGFVSGQYISLHWLWRNGNEECRPDRMCRLWHVVDPDDEYCPYRDMSVFKQEEKKRSNRGGVCSLIGVSL